MLVFVFQGDLQASGLKKWRNSSADTQSNGILSETPVTKVSKIAKLKFIPKMYP